MDLGDNGWGSIDWIDLAQVRDRWRALVSALMKFRVPINAGILSSGYTAGGLLSSVQHHRVNNTQ
jgi:hypothetical protein